MIVETKKIENDLTLKTSQKMRGFFILRNLFIFE